MVLGRDVWTEDRVEGAYDGIDRRQNILLIDTKRVPVLPMGWRLQKVGCLRAPLRQYSVVCYLIESVSSGYLGLSTGLYRVEQS